MSARKRKFWLRGENFFPRQPGGVLESLANILGFKIRIALENFLDRGPMGHLPYDDRDRDPHSPNAGAASHDLRIEGNPFKLHATKFSRLDKPAQKPHACVVRALLVLRG